MSFNASTIGTIRNAATTRMSDRGRLSFPFRTSANKANAEPPAITEQRIEEKDSPA